MVQAPALVETLGGIDGTWLDRVLSHAGIAAPPVGRVEHFPLGQGTTSAVLRLVPHYREQSAEAPSSLVLKMHRPHSFSFRPDPFRAGFEREVAAYRHFGQSLPCRVPRCLWAKFRADGAFNLVLEDLSADGVPGNQIAGCSLPEAEAVVGELGRLHAWGQQLGAAPIWAKSLATSAPVIGTFYRKGAKAARLHLSADLDAGMLAVIEGAVPLVEPWLFAVSQGAFVIHTDPRVDNFIFRHSGDEVQVYLLDFQQMAMGDPAFDLAYFLTGSIDPAGRRERERDLVEMHMAELRSAGVDGSAELAFERYRQHAISGLAATIAAAGSLELTPQVSELIVALARRNCVAVSELGGLEAAQRMIETSS